MYFMFHQNFPCRNIKKKRLVCNRCVSSVAQVAYATLFRKHGRLKGFDIDLCELKYSFVFLTFREHIKMKSYFLCADIFNFWSLIFTSTESSSILSRSVEHVRLFLPSVTTAMFFPSHQLFISRTWEFVKNV
jgi:hypothetical protein